MKLRYILNFLLFFSFFTTDIISADDRIEIPEKLVKILHSSRDAYLDVFDSNDNGGFVCLSSNPDDIAIWKNWTSSNQGKFTIFKNMDTSHKLNATKELVYTNNIFGGYHEHWFIQPSDGSRFCYIINRATGRCLDIEEVRELEDDKVTIKVIKKVCTTPYHGGKSQRWYIE